jgi:hypothetical protein
MALLRFQCPGAASANMRVAISPRTIEEGRQVRLERWAEGGGGSGPFALGGGLRRLN